MLLEIFSNTDDKKEFQYLNQQSLIISYAEEVEYLRIRRPIGEQHKHLK
jgi:hypothetical protein